MWCRVICCCLFLLSSWCSAAQDPHVTINNEEQLSKIVTLLSEQNEKFRQEIELQRSDLTNITERQLSISKQITYVQNTLKTLNEQGEWLSYSTALGETLRQQLLQLPEKPSSYTLDEQIAETKAKKINYSSNLSTLSNYSELTYPLSSSKFSERYLQQLQEQKRLLKTLVSGIDATILELIKLKIANAQLTSAINNVNESAHRYFFWVADVNPISLNSPVELVKDLMFVLFSVDSLSQFYHSNIEALTEPKSLFLLFFAFIFVIVHLKIRPQYIAFLNRTSSHIGKVSQDQYLLTLQVVGYSLFMACPIPILWGVLGYTLQMNWDYPVAIAFGYGVNASSPILWVFIICAYFAYPNGLFISHFRWSGRSVKAAMKYYQLSVWVIIPLVMIVMSFEHYNNHQFSATIGRSAFILLCFALVFMTNSIYRAGVPLYINRKGVGDNLASRILWFILLTAPWLAIVAACLGYLSTARVLLGRLETSVVIWFGLLFIYFMSRRWMWVQKRRLEFERAKQRRIEKLQRSKSSEELISGNDTTEEPEVDLDAIKAQSLHLVRSLIVMIALISMILLWSELHSAFAFMDNIKLWNTHSLVNGNEVEQYISLGALFIAILVMIITIQLVKNLPALLELGILQHLELSPGTGYAISTVSKYIVLMIGSIIAFSFIGIDWSKIQWLIAALGVGLGFGLQEIFANFVSGLIILFEKPIRIGDTITIRDLTGSVSKINTRATTIVDWDRKEIVMPNKAFVTEQLVNWSLSDSITRIALTIPATIDADSDVIINILKQAANDCEYVLDDPEPQIFLVDIQEGIQLFELRVFAAEMGHRMPLRSQIHQLIVQYYHEHNLVLPFPPLQTNLDAIGRKSGRRNYTVGSL